ncbi:GldM family protein [Flavobacterium sp.]|uniref:GldM family protein n=1 Tax=Flavobacterium sp. TaxID=239 RepID=UPI00260A7BF4|nr:GldM family protein [Flavobacterium sp.]
MKKILILLLLLSLYTFAQTDINISVISSERGNILYRGIPNPIKIAVPGAMSFSAEGPGLKKVDDNGNFSFNVSTISSDTVALLISAKMPNDSIIKESKIFVVRDISRLITLINGRQATSGIGIVIMSKKELKTAVISLTLKDPYLDSLLSVTRFEMYMPKTPGIRVEGNTVNKNASDYIDRLKPDDEVFITNISFDFKYMGAMRMKSPSPLIIKIKE